MSDFVTYNDPTVKRAIKSAIRKIFKRSPQYMRALYNARKELPPKVLKTGKFSNSPMIRYECNECKGLFMKKDVDVDHIEPSCPLDKPELEMSLEEIAASIICPIDNLQVLCSITLEDNNGVPSCHLNKSNRERFMRRKIKALKEAGEYFGITDELAATLEKEYLVYLVDIELMRVEKLAKKRKKME